MFEQITNDEIMTEAEKAGRDLLAQRRKLHETTADQFSARKILTYDIAPLIRAEILDDLFGTAATKIRHGGTLQESQAYLARKTMALLTDATRHSSAYDTAAMETRRETGIELATRY